MVVVREKKEKEKRRQKGEKVTWGWTHRGVSMTNSTQVGKVPAIASLMIAPEADHLRREKKAKISN